MLIFHPAMLVYWRVYPFPTWLFYRGLWLWFPDTGITRQEQNGGVAQQVVSVINWSCAMDIHAGYGKKCIDTKTQSVVSVWCLEGFKIDKIPLFHRKCSPHFVRRLNPQKDPEKNHRLFPICRNECTHSFRLPFPIHKNLKKLTSHAHRRAFFCTQQF